MDMGDVQRATDAIRARILERYPQAAAMPLVPHGNAVSHVLFMADEIDAFMKDGHRDKAMRWLGFAQGYLWADGFATIDELRDDNRTRG